MGGRWDQILAWRKLCGGLGQNQAERQLRCSEQYAFPLVSAIAILVKASSSDHKQKNIAPCAFRRTAQSYSNLCDALSRMRLKLRMSLIKICARFFRRHQPLRKGC